jgi:hypothetical protein
MMPEDRRLFMRGADAYKRKPLMANVVIVSDAGKAA